MAVQRQQNFLGQMRIDTSMLRSVESGVCDDLDVLAGRILAGRSPLVVKGFSLVTTGITAAEQLQLLVADSLLIHSEASESGSVFHVPADRAAETLSATISTRVSGAFTAFSVNYIGIDLIRSADASTSDLAAFLDTISLTETFREVPMARTLDYVISIGTTDFSSNPNIAPIAIVTTGAGNTIVSIQDARSIAWRLGTGGAVPNTKNAFPWPAGRKEDSSFVGGDKAITSFKGWADAAMTRMWELGGGEYWYSPTADRNMKVVEAGTFFSSSNEGYEWTGTNLHWQGLVVVFDNSTVNHNTIADQTTNSTGLTDLADGECIYVDVDRTQVVALTAVKAVLLTLGTPTVPGSRHVLAWRYGSNVFTRSGSKPVGTIGGRVLGVQAANLVNVGGLLTFGTGNSALYTSASSAAVNAIATAGWSSGSEVTVIFKCTGGAGYDVLDNTGVAGGAPLWLDGHVDLSLASGDGWILKFIYIVADALWYETSRKQILP